MIFFYLKIYYRCKMQEQRRLKYTISLHTCSKRITQGLILLLISLFLSFFLSYFISSPTPFSCYCNPSAVATHVHYTCVMHQEAKRKRENRISSTSPPVLPLNHRYRPHTFSFGLSAQKKREEGEEGEKGRRGRRKEQM